jgi:hypothetical protein
MLRIVVRGSRDTDEATTHARIHSGMAENIISTYLRTAFFAGAFFTADFLAGAFFAAAFFAGALEPRYCPTAFFTARRCRSASFCSCLVAGKANRARFSKLSINGEYGEGIFPTRGKTSILSGDSTNCSTLPS